MLGAIPSSLISIYPGTRRTPCGVCRFLDNEVGRDKFHAGAYFLARRTGRIWLLRWLAAGISDLDQAPAEDGILAWRAQIDCRFRERLGNAIGISRSAFGEQRRNGCRYERGRE